MALDELFSSAQDAETGFRTRRTVSAALFFWALCPGMGSTLRRPLGSRLLLHAIDSDDIVLRVGLADLSGCHVFR